MATPTINELSALIKQQIELQESIYEYIKKSKVLLDYALETQLLHLQSNITHYYFWTVSDMANQAYKLSGLALDALIVMQKYNRTKVE